MINIDKLIIGFDGALRTLLTPAQTLRSVPGSELPEAELTDREKRLSCALMRVNHVGEVCAQALYQGQGLTARNEGSLDGCRALRPTRRFPQAAGPRPTGC